MNTSPGSILYKSPTTSTNGMRKSFGPDGCQAVIDGARCGETKNLQIIKEFRRLYEDKMKQIDDIAGGDCIQAKVNLQQEWIRDLTDQNEMLVRVVEELEVEAAERVTLLEKKLQQSSKSAGEKEDVLKEKDRQIKELETQLKSCLQGGKDDFDTLKKEYKDLEQSTLDMRDALTAEVADKHDTILCLRREVHLLEEQCRKADQQTHFKDDIIKELRKEIKQLKQQQTLQNQTSPPKHKSRSPRKRVHHCKTEPDTNVNHLKDGTIVIRDSETIGDSLHTQAIKEKFTDPTNQTIVYICESVPQRPKCKDDKCTLLETHNCDVSMDCPKSLSHTPNSVNPHSPMDLPRDNSMNLSQEVSLSSFHNMSVMSQSTIQETCIQYSRDILDLLNQTYHMAERKISPKQNTKGLDSYEYSMESSRSSCSAQSPNNTFQRSSGGCHSCKQKTNNTSGLKKRNLDRKVEKLTPAMNSNKRSNQNKFSTDGTLELIYENESLVRRPPIETSKTFTSNAVQTIKEDIVEKNTQTSRTKVQNDLSTSRKKKSCAFIKTSHKYTESENKNKSNQTCVLCGNDNTTLISLLSKNNQSTKEEYDKPTSNQMDNAFCHRNYSATTPYKTESKEISFNENEIRAFSSPYPDEDTATRDVIQIKQIFRGDNSKAAEGKVKGTYPPQEETQVRTRRLGPHKSVAIPIQPFFAEPNYRQPKPLSTRTLRRAPRYLDDVALSAKSQSLPSCAPAQQSRLARVNYIRPPVIANYNYVDTHYLIEQRKKRFAFDVGMEKKIVHRGYIDRCPHFNNTY